VGPIRTRLGDRGFRLDLWDVFVGDRTTCLAASNRVLDAGLPTGWTVSAFPEQADGERMISIQRFLADNGIATVAGTMLCGGLCPSTGVMLADGDAAVAATAYGYLPHNSFSPYANYAWCGLVAVADQYRGRRLGAYVNARAVVGFSASSLPATFTRS